jgi:hypothetical protein
MSDECDILNALPFYCIDEVLRASRDAPRLYGDSCAIGYVGDRCIEAFEYLVQHLTPPW